MFFFLCLSGVRVPLSLAACNLTTRLVSGEQESPGLCDDLPEHTAAHRGGVQRAGGAAAPGGAAVHHGDADEYSEGCREGEASADRSPAGDSAATFVHCLIHCLQHRKEDGASQRSGFWTHFVWAHVQAFSKGNVMAWHITSEAASERGRSANRLTVLGSFLAGTTLFHSLLCSVLRHGVLCCGENCATSRFPCERPLSPLHCKSASDWRYTGGVPYGSVYFCLWR